MSCNYRNYFGESDSNNRLSISRGAGTLHKWYSSRTRLRETESGTGTHPSRTTTEIGKTQWIQSRVWGRAGRASVKTHICYTLKPQILTAGETHLKRKCGTETETKKCNLNHTEVVEQFGWQRNADDPSSSEVAVRSRRSTVNVVVHLTMTLHVSRTTFHSIKHPKNKATKSRSVQLAKPILLGFIGYNTRRIKGHWGRTKTYASRCFAVLEPTSRNSLTQSFCDATRHSDNFKADWKRRCSVWPTGVIWLHTRDCLGC